MAQVITLFLSTTTFDSNILSFNEVPTYAVQLGASVTGINIPSNSFVTDFTSTTISINNVVTCYKDTAITITDNAGSVLKSSTDYKIKVPNGGTIRLDTGANVGRVFVTGDLNVQGSTTTINTTNLAIEDNILTLNKGELGYQVSEVTSGIEIDRGTATSGNAQFLWDESLTWVDPWSQTTRSGLWVFKTKTYDQINGIYTNSIETGGNNLGLISKGTGVISVKGTNDYERQVLNYNSNLSIIDDDIVPNIRAVGDKIFFEINNNPGDKIKRDDTQVVVYDNNITGRITYITTAGMPSTSVNLFHNLITNSEINVYPGTYVTIVGSNISNLNGTWPVSVAAPTSQTFTILVGSAVNASNQINTASAIYVNGSKSNVRVFIDNAKVTEFQDNHVDIFNLRLQDTTIETSVSGADLILIAPGAGSVQIKDNLRMAHVSSDPTSVSGSVKIYTKTNGAGGTGIYFVNDTFALNVNDYKRDELISKKKAIAFSILM